MPSLKSLKRSLGLSISTVLIILQSLMLVWNSEYFMEKLERSGQADAALKVMALVPLLFGSLLTLHELVSEFPEEVKGLKERRAHLQAGLDGDQDVDVLTPGNTHGKYKLSELQIDAEFQPAEGDELTTWLENPKMLAALNGLQFAFFIGLGVAEFLNAPFAVSLFLSYSGLFQEWAVRRKAKNELHDLTSKVLRYESQIAEQEAKLRQYAAVYANEVNGIGRQINAAQQEIIGLFRMAKTCSEQACEAMKSLASIEHEMGVLEATFDQQNRAQEDLRSKIIIVEHQLREAQDEFELFRLELTKAEGELRENRILGNKKSASSSEHLLKKRHVDLLRRVKEAEADIAKQQETLNSLHRKNAIFHQNLECSMREQELLRQRLSMLHAEQSSLRHIVAEKERDNQQNTAQLERIEEEVEQLKEQYAEQQRLQACHLGLANKVAAELADVGGRGVKKQNGMREAIELGSDRVASRQNLELRSRAIPNPPPLSPSVSSFLADSALENSSGGGNNESLLCNSPPALALGGIFSSSSGSKKNRVAPASPAVRRLIVAPALPEHTEDDVRIHIGDAGGAGVAPPTS